jgi:hypothetical protein
MIFVKRDDLSLYIKYRYQFFLDDVRLFSKIAQYADSILRIFSALVSAGDNCIFRDNVIKSILIFYQNGLIFDIEKVVLVLDFRTVSQTILFWRKPFSANTISCKYANEGTIPIFTAFMG